MSRSHCCHVPVVTSIVVMVPVVSDEGYNVEISWLWVEPKHVVSKLIIYPELSQEYHLSYSARSLRGTVRDRRTNKHWRLYKYMDCLFQTTNTYLIVNPESKYICACLPAQVLAVLLIFIHRT